MHPAGGKKKRIDPVAFKDAGSVGEEGRATVTIDPSNAGSFFDLYVVNRRVDGSYADANEDIYGDWGTPRTAWSTRFRMTERPP